MDEIRQGASHPEQERDLEKEMDRLLAYTCTFCGHTFSADEIELMCQIAADCSALGTTEIARTVCELLD